MLEDLQTEKYESPHELYSNFFVRLKELSRHDPMVNEYVSSNGVLVLKHDKLIEKHAEGWHTTIWYDAKNKILNVHRTVEGPENVHQESESYEIGRLKDDDFDRIEKVCYRVVRAGDPEFAGLRISIRNEPREFQIYKVSGRRATLDIVERDALENNFHNVDLDGFEKSDALTGMVFRKEKLVGLIWWSSLGCLYYDIEKHGHLEWDLMNSIRSEGAKIGC